MSPALVRALGLLAVAAGYVQALSLPSTPIVLPSGFVVAEEILLPGIDAASLPKAPGDYKAVPLRWVGQAFAGGPNITIVGRDLDQIRNKLFELNPDFAAVNQAQLASQSAVTSSRLRKRYDYHTVCYNPYFHNGYGGYFNLNQGHLRDVGGWCIVDGGQGSCNRCADYGSSGTWMCNDSTRGVTHQYMYCTDMADQHDTIVRACGTNLESIYNAQWFRHDTEYSVLEAGD